MQVNINAEPTLAVPTVQYRPVKQPEPTLGGLAFDDGHLTGDPSVLIWMAVVASTGKVW
jgi:hypothetical protein